MSVLFISTRNIQAVISMTGKCHQANRQLHLSVNVKKDKNGMPSTFAGYISRDAARKIVRYARAPERAGAVVSVFSDAFGHELRRQHNMPLDLTTPTKRA